MLWTLRLARISGLFFILYFFRGDARTLTVTSNNRES